MDPTSWLKGGEAGTYVYSILNDEVISNHIWQHCYMPYLKPYLSQPQHIFYHAPYNPDIRAHLLASGAQEGQVQAFRLKHVEKDGIFMASNLPNGVVHYPAQHILSRASRMSLYPLLPDALDKFALRCFDDVAASVALNERRYHEGEITNDERQRNINTMRAKCIPLPSWRGYSPIEWSNQLV